MKLADVPEAVQADIGRARQGRRGAPDRTPAGGAVPLFQRAIRCCAPRCGVLVSAADAVTVHAAYVAHMDTHHNNPGGSWK